ncbi:hypothetical protein [Arthrobacter sp. NtRootA1]|uniref:hypothetical protein n=1 Tax=Arthrobacter sp. NtRootA1 TaxID=2830983 RepID=UPI001CC4EBF0|nr:hypothetical protein [Arthrobacter sp. NtRootA1]BCW04818.1 hypothetical protein NtRootA1_09560 [Arthrobacter sp. NtRootA1]
MPYQGVVSPTQTTPTKSEAPTLPVIPGVDLVRGTVTLFLNGGLTRFRHPEAQLLARALAQAVRPSRWCASSRTLTVTVAALGRPAGLERHFTFDEEGPA